MQTRTPEVKESPELKPAPQARGSGAGAPASPGAGEAPTTPVIPRVEINLSELYEYLAPQSTAAEILRSILRNYEGVEIIAMINYSPDTGTDIIAEDPDVRQKIKELDRRLEEYHKALRYGREVKNAPRSFEELVERVAEVLGTDLVIELFDGYERAYAFISVEE